MDLLSSTEHTKNDLKILQDPSAKTALLTRCGAVPPHFRNEATLYLDKRLSHPMVRCAGPTEWPTRSPDLTHVNHS